MMSPAGKAMAEAASNAPEAIGWLGKKPRMRVSWGFIFERSLRAQWLLKSADSSGVRAPRSSSNSRVQVSPLHTQLAMPSCEKKVGHQTSTRPADSPPAKSFESRCSNGLCLERTFST